MLSPTWLSQIDGLRATIHAQRLANKGGRVANYEGKRHGVRSSRGNRSPAHQERTEPARMTGSVDGHSLGHVVRKPYSSEPFGWWWAEPSRPVVSDNREVDQNPENPLWWGLRLVGRPGVRPMRRRTEAVLTLCDMQGPGGAHR